LFRGHAHNKFFFEFIYPPEAVKLFLLNGPNLPALTWRALVFLLEEKLLSEE